MALLYERGIIGEAILPCISIMPKNLVEGILYEQVGFFLIRTELFHPVLNRRYSRFFLPVSIRFGVFIFPQ